MILISNIQKSMPIFSINIDEILVMKVWRVLPCNFQIQLLDAFGIEAENLLFQSNLIYTKTKSQILKQGGFLKNGYARVINFVDQIDCCTHLGNNFIADFSKSRNITNIFSTFGEPHFHTGTSEGYDIFVYFGSHKCSYKILCNGILIFVVGLSGNIVAFNLTFLKCRCFDQSNERIYTVSKKSEFI